MEVSAVGKLGDRFHGFDRRIDAYRDCPVPDWTPHDLVIRAMDFRAITPKQVPNVIGEWRSPSHEAFRPQTLWSLFNAFTEVYKAQDHPPQRSPPRPLRWCRRAGELKQRARHHRGSFFRSQER